MEDIYKLLASPISFEEVSFTEAKTGVAQLKVEYLLITNGVKFHIWPRPEFPQEIERCLLEALRVFPKENTIVEYVPEVESWYAEIKNTNTPLTDNLVEYIVKKIATAVDKYNGKENKEDIS